MSTFWSPGFILVGCVDSRRKCPLEQGLRGGTILISRIVRENITWQFTFDPGCSWTHDSVGHCTVSYHSECISAGRDRLGELGGDQTLGSEFDANRPLGSAAGGVALHKRKDESNGIPCTWRNSLRALFLCWFFLVLRVGFFALYKFPQNSWCSITLFASFRK